jgi:hypothetical protein
MTEPKSYIFPDYGSPRTPDQQEHDARVADAVRALQELSSLADGPDADANWRRAEPEVLQPAPDENIKWWLPKVAETPADAHLPTAAPVRKGLPVYSGVLKYFPDALVAIAELSRIGNDQHNPGQPLFWDRSKSGDELDALTRHLLDAGTIDTDGVRHSTKVAWRALANLQKEIERATNKG